MNPPSLPGDPLRTTKKITWCPSCPDNMILESSQKAIESLIKQGHKRESFAMTCGVGCHGKIFDYLNISGLYGLHGRAIPLAIGIKLGNPNLNVIAFAGDGDTYSEGMAHFIHACRFNPDITLIVFDNQSFSLTTGQATPTSQLGFKTKSEPLGEFNQPLNPIHLALSANATFVARCNARDLDHTQQTIEAAIKHKGFSFVEVIQDCMVFNLETNGKDDRMYKIPKPQKLSRALKLARQFDYNQSETKIPLGIFYQTHRNTLYEEWPQLQNLKKKRISWKQLKR
ncbi:2-oxoglutarate synthase [Candidatus Pacearchaeota archaeon]|nr:2-oxoglutarate synthase [Candidatus Pacearchaeota archaeon]